MTQDLWSPRPERVAIFRALQLGDMLCAVPALRALRRFLPQARITLVGLPWAASFVERYRHLVDDHLSFPGYPGNPEEEGAIGDLLDCLVAAQHRRFDVAIQLHGSGELSNRIVAALGASRVAGFKPHGAPPPGPWFITWPESQPEIHRYLSLMAYLGVPLQGTDLEMPLTDSDVRGWNDVASRHSLTHGGFVCIHPGARLRSRRWPVERFAAVASGLARDGWRVVVTGSPAEAEVTRGVVDLTHGGAIDLTGATTLGSLSALLSHCALLVCNDTGVSHVAAAMRVPSVVIASGSDVGRWAPLDHGLHPVLWHDMPCRPCAHEVCPIGHGCALGVGVETVLARARQVLHQPLRHAA
jgi:ADP-heptose:LPS heptosyltransferase